MATQTTNMHLTKPGTNDTADIAVINANMDTLDGHRHLGGTDGLPARAVQAGLLANRPAAGTAGQLYVATDVPALYIDTGSTWELAAQGQLWQSAQSNTTPNGTTTMFNIGSGVASSKVRVFVNGLLRRPTSDYSFTAGNTYVTFAWAPASGDDVRMDYVAV